MFSSAFTNGNETITLHYFFLDDPEDLFLLVGDLLDFLDDDFLEGEFVRVTELLLVKPLNLTP